MRPLAFIVTLVCAGLTISAEPEAHWSLRPRTRPDVPSVHNPKSAIRTPVDAFILARLETEGLSPALEADRAMELVESYDTPLDVTGMMEATSLMIQACVSYVHIVRGEYPVRPGLILGHEPVGVIAELGPGLQDLYQVGERVIVGAITPCGQCRACLSTKPLKGTCRGPIDRICEIRQGADEGALVARANGLPVLVEDVRSDIHERVDADSFGEHMPTRVLPLFREKQIAR